MKKIIFFVLLVHLCLTANAQMSGVFEAKRGESDYNFWIYTPHEYAEDNHKLPLIVFLHGASLCGNNLERVRRYGTLDAIEKGLDVPMLVVAPQNPGGAWNPKKLMNLLEWVEEHYRVDESRVYVLGMSLGGYGTMDFAGTYPDKIAAAMALCGGCSLKDDQGLGKLPLWIIHGTGDAAVSVKQSQRVVDDLQQANNDKLLRYYWVPGGSHGLLARAFYLQQTYDWLIAHSLNDSPREVDRDIQIEREDFNVSYRDLKIDPQMYAED
ncbi:MAG: phospholipase [Prevotella sp.]|jgi:predicted peptidase|nr:phospholipase [Prevotella sp.]MBQ2225372.1 dienelactone hydrolase family protein [Prevotella sp.]